jgi:hypothetical protein
VPDLWINSLSINNAVMNGFMIGNEGLLIKLTKGETTLMLDQRLSTKGRFVSGIKMVPVFNQVANTVFETEKMIKAMSVEINKLHKILDHCGENHLKATANDYGSKVFGKLETYEPCDISKVKKKKTNKVWTGSSNVPGERLYLDISSIKDESFGGAKFWNLIVNDYADYFWSYFVKGTDQFKTKEVESVE